MDMNAEAAMVHDCHAGDDPKTIHKGSLVGLEGPASNACHQMTVVDDDASD